MNTYIIGDIQGCADELSRLLDSLRFDSTTDQLLLVGDLVNRGPKSVATLRLARSLGDSCVCVLGNHDLSVLAQLLGNGSHSRLKDAALALSNQPDAADLLDWLRRRPLAHHAAGRLMVHAGVPPQWSLEQTLSCAREVEAALQGPKHADFLSQLYGDQPDMWDDQLVGQERLRFIVNCLTRLRFCTPDGRLLLDEKGAPEANTMAERLPWFALPQRATRSHPIVFGHWSTLGKVFWPQHKVWGLDTGCVWGGRMSALHWQTQRLISAASSGYKKPGGD